MKKVNDLYFVGALQEVGLPYSSIYIRKGNRQLYLFVRLSPFQDKNDEYLMVPVTPKDVKGYMDESLRLSDILKKDTSRYAIISDNDIYLGNNSVTPDLMALKGFDYFDPDLCDDEIWMETFLNRVESGLPLNF